MQLSDRDRRAPVVTEHHLEADPRMLRGVLAEVDGSLGDLDSMTRRKATLIVAALADHWMRMPPETGDRVKLKIEHSSIRLRITASTAGSELPAAVWERVGQATAVGLADSWGVERQGTSGAWFEVTTTS